MLCGTCRFSERPGFIRRETTALAADVGADLGAAAEYLPCPDCGGQAIAYCCDGLCEPPEPEATAER